MNPKRLYHLLVMPLVLALLFGPLGQMRAFASPPAVPIDSGPVIADTEMFYSGLGGFFQTPSLSIEAVLPGYSPMTPQDYQMAYNEAKRLFEIGGRICGKISSVPNESGVSAEAWAQLTFNVAGGARWEWAHLETTETTFDANALAIGTYENLKQLKEAAIQADVEKVRSAQRVKELLIQETEQLIQVENAQIELKRVVAEHNMLRDRYMLLLSQRAAAKEQLAASNLAKPYYRLARDSAALATARTLDAAVQVLYLAAKAYEYDTLTPYSGMNKLYLVRNENDVYEVANKLHTEYTLALDPNRNFSIGKHNLSLAQDVLGLSDAILNPDGALNPAEVEQLRRAQFQTLLSQARRGDKVTFTFATTVDNSEFLRSVWNERITDAASIMPGCATGCRGLGVNLVTDQPASEFATGLPAVRLTQGGVATYRDSAGQTVSYRPGPAAIVGFQAPAGLDKYDAVDVLNANVNAASNSEPGGGSFSNKFRMRSVAAGKWVLELDLTETVNHPIQLDKIHDIEIGFDTTYLTLTDANALSAANAGTESVQASAQQAADLHCTPDNQDAFLGVADVTAPVSLGTVSIGFDLHIATDGRVSGKLRHDCSPLYDSPAALTGVYDAATRRIAFSSEPLTRTMAGRVATRSLSFTGIVTDSILIDGVYTETIQDYTAEPVVASGSFLVSRPSSNVATTGNNGNQTPLAVNDNFSVAANSANNLFDVLANDRVVNGAAKLLVAVGTPPNGVATSNGTTILYSPNPGFEGNDSFTYTVGDGNLTSIGAVTVKIGRGFSNKFIYLPMVSR